MNLSALHAHIRDAVRSGGGVALLQPTVGEIERMSAAERLALQAFHRRLQGVGGEIGRLMPPAGSQYWTASSPQESGR